MRSESLAWFFGKLGYEVSLSKADTKPIAGIFAMVSTDLPISYCLEV
jgi:hypothetical protein